MAQVAESEPLRPWKLLVWSLESLDWPVCSALAWKFSIRYKHIRLPQLTSTYWQPVSMPPRFSLSDGEQAWELTKAGYYLSTPTPAENAGRNSPFSSTAVASLPTECFIETYNKADQHRN